MVVKAPEGRIMVAVVGRKWENTNYQELGIRNQELGIRNPELGIRNPESGI